MEEISLDFHCFKALNNNLEAWLFLHVHFYASSDLLMVCRTMQLRIFKLGTVLTYAYKIVFSCFSLHLKFACIILHYMHFMQKGYRYVCIFGILLNLARVFHRNAQKEEINGSRHGSTFYYQWSMVVNVGLSGFKFSVVFLYIRSLLRDPPCFPSVILH